MNVCMLSDLALKPLPLRAQPSQWQQYPEFFSGFTCESFTWSTRSCRLSNSRWHYRVKTESAERKMRSTWIALLIFQGAVCHICFTVLKHKNTIICLPRIGKHA